MAFGLKISSRGQISIEFMLILFIALLYLVTIQTNLVTPAINSANDVSRLGESRLGAEKIVNAINEVSVSNGDAKQTLHVFLPEESTIGCSTSPTKITVTVLTSLPPSPATVNLPASDNGLTVDCFPALNSPKTLYDITVVKSGNNLTISAAS